MFFFDERFTIDLLDELYLLKELKQLQSFNLFGNKSS